MQIGKGVVSHEGDALLLYSSVVYSETFPSSPHLGYLRDAKCLLENGLFADGCSWQFART